MAQKVENQALDARWEQVETARKTRGVYHKLFTLSQNEKAVDESKRTVRFVITTGSVDRDNDTISPKGWDVGPYVKNPVVLWAHDYSALPVARAMDIISTANGLESTAQFPPKGVHPFADTVFELLKGGFLNATSVGFRPLEAKRNDDRGGIDFEKQEMLEYSIVPVPANSEALTVARSKGINVDLIEGWAEGITKRRDGRVNKAMAQMPSLRGSVANVLDEAAKYAVRRGSAETFDAAMESLTLALAALEATLKADTPETPHIPDLADTVPPMGDGQCPAGYERDGGMCRRKKDVAPAGQATNPCPACGWEMGAEDHCSGCGWQKPDGIADANDGNGDNQDDMHKRGRVMKAANMQAQVTVDDKGQQWKTFQAEKNDPPRWNRTASKAFDVAAEPLEANRTELAWVARYLETPIQQISTEEFFVPSARMGSFLSAYDESLSDWSVDATRHLTESGREVPPEFESIQLNSKTTKSFLVGGTRFMRRLSDNVKMVAKIQPVWMGIYVAHYVRHEQSIVRTKFVEQTQNRAAQINYLRGEAFTLGGEFLDRGNLNWDALFLGSKEEGVLRRAVERINEDGEQMESRGLMMMGPPGTGKTLSGRVMLRQADTTFIWVSARDFYRSGSFGAFTYAFDLASECAPSIIFFEDVDNWITSTEVDLLKTEMDGLKRRKGVLTVLTTNFPELIPDALIDRPGRFHDLVELALPTEDVRMRMLAAWLPESSIEERSATAKATDGFSGAHLRELVNFAETIGAEEKLGTGDSLTRALAKLQEQRELVASLREAPDYRPRRQIRSLVAGAMTIVSKRGRVLSAANETRLRTACDHMASAGEHISTVLAAVAPDDPEDADEVKSGQVLEFDEPIVPEIVLDLDVDVEDSVALDVADARSAIDEAMSAALAGIGPMVRERTATALAQARGRVD